MTPSERTRRNLLGVYRPAIVLVITILVVAFLPGRDDGSKPEGVASGGQVEGGGQGSLPSGDASGLGEATSSTTIAGNSTPQGAAGAGTATVTARNAGAGNRTATAGAGATSTTAPSSATGAAPSAGSYPGIASEAALSSPNCDRATGRVRIPLRYAPPCVAPWPKGADNGGATHMGVTKDTITFVLYDPPATGGQRTDDDRRQTIEDWQSYVDIFNAHYEFWGRKVKMVYFEGTGTDEVAQRADAIRVTSDIKPMFSTVNAGVVAETFSRELAARGVVVFDANAPWTATQEQAPRRWASTADERTVILHFAEYAGKRLKGLPAKWAGDPAYQPQSRKFGLVFPDNWDKRFIDQTLAAQGVTVASAISYTAGELAGFQERARVMIGRVKADGVTSVINGADWTFNIVLTKEATAQLYFPEWVMTGWAYQDVVLFARLNDQQQWSHAFGPGPVMVLTPPPNYETSGKDRGSIWEWHYGSSKEPHDQAQIGSASSPLVPFAACLQLAGPRLNPTSFRDGCFAYPPTGGTHCSCSMTIGFSFGRRPGVPWLSYTAWDDMAEKWWDPNASGPDEAGLTPTGGYYRRAENGKRYAVGQWPAGEPKVFDPANTATYREDYTAEERPPQYTHQPH